MPSIDTTTSPGGDIRWMAPERILGGGKVTVKGDVWAFGMTMLVCSPRNDFPYFSY